MADFWETVLFMPDLHCSTCVLFVKKFITDRYPSVSSVKLSCTAHQVTINHQESLDMTKLHDSLVLAGYRMTSGSTTWVDSTNGHVHATSSLTFDEHCETAFDRAEHQHHCDHCKRTPSTLEEKFSASSIASSPELEVVVQQKASAKVHTQLSIEGMSCSSCVGKVSKAIQAFEWVVSADVALLTSSADIVHYGTDVNVQKLVEAVSNLGYEANVQKSVAMGEEDAAVKHTEGQRDLWQAVLSAEILTEPDSEKVTKALSSIPTICQVKTKSGLSVVIISFRGKENLPTIVKRAAQAGFPFEVEQVFKAGSQSWVEKATRSVTINIQGMYCDQCPSRISAHLLQRFVKTDLTLIKTDKSFLTFSYTPHVSRLTIRTLLAAIEELDPKFSGTLYQPESPEERSQRMHSRTRKDILFRAILSLVFAVPTFLIGVVFMSLVPEDSSERVALMQHERGVSRAEWTLFDLSTPVYFFAADLFHRRAIKEVYYLWHPRSSTPLLSRFYRFGSMDMLMSLGTSIAYFASIAEVVVASSLKNSTMNARSGSTYFDSVVFLTMFLLLGRFLEAYSKEKTGQAVSKLKTLRPLNAHLVLDDKRTEEVSVALLECGDVVRVLHGESPPWDAYVIQGQASFSEASLTGESRAVQKGAGDQVYSGTINTGSAITVRLTGASGRSMLDQIIDAVRQGQARRAPIERVADTLTSYFVPVVTLFAIVTWLIWMGLGVSGRLPRHFLDVSVGGWPFWSLQFAIAVFVIACPCGIGLAAPTALYVGGGLAAQQGILVKGGGEAFQDASRVDIVVFDKTGTLTHGEDIAVSSHMYLPRAAASIPWELEIFKDGIRLLEETSTYPIAKAVGSFVEEALSEKKAVVELVSVHERAGKGMEGTVRAKGEHQEIPIFFDMVLGNERLLAEKGVSFDNTMTDQLETWKEEAKSIVLVAARQVLKIGSGTKEWSLVAAFGLSDTIRPDAADVVHALHQRGIETWMISGNNEQTARAVSSQIGIPSERVIAGVLPGEKALQVQKLQQKRQIEGRLLSKGAIVAMVGDGVNDSPALATSDVGIAIGSGSDIAISSASFILIKSDLTSLLTLIVLSHKVIQRVKINFAWALVYNLVALPVAAGALYPIRSGEKHVRLDPVWASLAMALSSVSVVCSSLLLRSRLPVLGYRKRK